MAGLIGRKVGMTSIFDGDGKILPCTVLEMGPCQVVQIRNTEKDGYSAVQLGFEDLKKKAVTKSANGHFKKANVAPKGFLKEFQFANMSEMKQGDTVSVENFSEGDFVDISGTSKGKGFQGVVKRHGFAGVGDKTHGQHNRLRAPGAIGACSYPAKVFKGMRMAGQMGNEKVKAINLKVLKIDAEKNIMLVKGAVPGGIKSIVTITK